MSDEQDAPTFINLRRRAEDQLQEEAVAPEELSPAEAARLIHELRVHQVELEMQNEELRQTQMKLAESRDRYADLFDFASVGCLTLNRNGQITEANLTAAAILGKERSRLLEKFFWLYLVEADRKAFHRMMANVQNLPERKGEFQFQGTDGRMRTMLLNTHFSKDHHGNLIQRLNLTDITELKQAQHDLEESQEKLQRLNQTLEQRVKERTLELEQANKELAFFSYAVARDLKVPLRSIEGFSRMLLKEHAAGLDPEGRRLLQVVVDNTQLLRRLIDDLLNLARLACQEIRKVPIDLASMAQGVFLRLQSQEPEKDLRFSVQEPPPAWGDYRLLYRVLMNLLENAIKFTRDHKTALIEVGGRSEDEENIYYVKDNGIGFNQDDVQKMFVVFQRLYDGKKYEGTGVGLATVQRIIQRHGGRVWAEGKPGGGATFYFSLPKKAE
jgi:PAS domain S-box-containing protein